MNPGPDQPSHGHEYPSLEKSPPPQDAYAPVDYPTDTGQLPPPYPGPFDAPPPGYPYPGPPQPGYPQAGYPPPPPQAPYQQYAGGYPPYGYDPYRPQQPMGTNGKAIAALVTSLLGLLFCGLPSIAGLILGVIAMRETKRTGQEGHGLALAGVIVGALAVAGWLLYAVIIMFAIAVSSTSPSYY